MADNYLVRENNISRLKEMLAKLGNQEYEAAVAHLAEDVYCDWPYLPAPGLSESMTGKDNLRSFFEGGMSAFEP
ncbi:MAG: hypothetical protein ACR2PS_10535, partial [Pseudomonadales bacterium]